MRFTPAKNGYESIFLDIEHHPLLEDYEFRCNYDSGKVFSSATDGLTLSLQRMVGGNTLTFFNTGLDGQCELIIAPYSEEGIMYRAHGKAGHSLVNPKGTQKRGDYVKLASLDASISENGSRVWHVIEARGVWEKR